MRRVRDKIDPEDASRWVDYARYVARVARIGATDATVAALRKAAEAEVDPAREEPARMILRALDARDDGRPCRPYNNAREG